MVGLAWLRWLLTVAFGCAGLFHLIRCLRPALVFPTPTAEQRLSEALHLIMGVAMVVMIWPWGEVVPVGVWVGVFAASTGWFAARAVSSVGRRLAPGFFATSMAVMVWMGAAMPVQASVAGGNMPGMTMRAHRSPGYAAWVSAALGGYLVVVAVWWILRGLRVGGLTSAGVRTRPVGWAELCHGVMSAGMGLALLAMVP